ncbi:MAG: PAS domain S-box protein, partial [Thermoplasmatales archaeon]|nr:PAS domain S-box protein [Thermoplasmatales archaeon]
MKDEPDIIKELREDEKLGKIKNLPKDKQDTSDVDNENFDKEFAGTVHVFEEKIKDEEGNINLEDIEKNFEIIFENYHIAITLADEKERIVSWNKYTEELFNMDEKELFMKPVEKLYPTEEWKKIREKNIRQKGIKYKLETKMIRKDEELFDAEISLCVLKGRDGKTAGSIGIIRDITKLKNTERKLTESEEKYRTIFENSAVAITLTDENENIISWNNYAEKLLEMGKEELYMKPVKSLYP